MKLVCQLGNGPLFKARKDMIDFFWEMARNRPSRKGKIYEKDLLCVLQLDFVDSHGL